MGDVIEEISDVLGVAPRDWIEQEQGFKSYRRSLIGPANARLYFDPRNGSDFNLSLPGRACQRAGTERLRMFFSSFVDAGAKARRVDLALDDYEKRITPARFLEELRGPNKVAHSKKVITMTGEELGMPETGETVYLGAPKSVRRLRVYDKWFESGGLIDAIRWELQERERATEKAAYDLAHGDWNEVIHSRTPTNFSPAQPSSTITSESRKPSFQIDSAIWVLVWWNNLMGSILHIQLTV